MKRTVTTSFNQQIIHSLMILSLFVVLLSGCQQVKDLANSKSDANSNTATNSNANSNANANSSASNKSADNTSANNEAEAEKSKAKDRIAQEQTVKDIKNVSNAIAQYLTDNGRNIYPKGLQPRSSEDSSIRASLRVRSGDTQNAVTEQSRPVRLNYIPIQVSVSLEDYQMISYEKLKEALVPKYINELPEKDGWGHPFQFYAILSNPPRIYYLAICSPGRDGKYQGTSYTPGEFPSDNFDEDIVLMDGTFVRSPRKQPQS